MAPRPKALSKVRDVEFGAGFAAGLGGDVGLAQAMADELERRFPEATSVKLNYVPTLRGVAALRHHGAAHAVEVLETARQYELGEPSSSFFGFFGALYPVYVRGTAYLALQDGTKAAEEFEKIVAHKGVLISDPVGAVAYLQLGRAYAMAGGMGKAKVAYGKFLTLWKDGDADVPVLREARAEMGRLR